MSMNQPDGILAQVTGTVARVFKYSGGTASVIEWKRPESEWPERVTVWDAEYPQGQRVTVRGKLFVSKKIDGEKTYVNLSLNDAQLLGGEF